MKCPPFPLLHANDGQIGFRLFTSNICLGIKINYDRVYPSSIVSIVKSH